MLFVRYHLSLLIKKITNPTIQSFLDYIPYTVLAAMTFPDIFYSTGHLISGIVATIIIIYASYKELSLHSSRLYWGFFVVMDGTHFVEIKHFFLFFLLLSIYIERVKK